MEYYEILGFAVDGLYVNMIRILERDGLESPQYKKINEKYQQIYKLYQQEHIEHLATQK